MKNICICLFLIISILSCDKKDGEGVLPPPTQFCKDLIANDIVALEAMLTSNAMTYTSSDWKENMDAIESWLISQNCLISADALHNEIETFPVITEIVFIYNDSNNVETTKTIDYHINDGGTVSFYRFHE